MGLWGSLFCLLLQAKISGTFEVKEYLGSGGTFLATKPAPPPRLAISSYLWGSGHLCSGARLHEARGTSR